LDILEKEGRAVGRRWPARRGTGSASLAAGGAGRKQALRALLLLLCLGGCTDLRVAHHVQDPAARIESQHAFRFLRAPLAADDRTSASARTMDAAVRAAIAGALQARGYTPALPEDAGVLGVDFTLSDAGGANARRLDSPSDYSRSWRGGGSDDGTGSMDHTIADVAFYRELTITVLLFPSSTGTLAWQGTARQSFPAELPQGARLQAALDRMMRKLLVQLPPSR
jgi:hypothetical protein